MFLKKFMFVFFVSLFMPLVGQAVSVDVPSADMSLDMPDYWYVFTRDNIEGNAELDELGLTIDFMNELFLENDIYIDGFDENMEMLLYVVPVDDVGSLPDYYDFEIADFGEELQGIVGSSDYEIVNNDYKYVSVAYEDQGYEIVEYYTIIDNLGYTFSFQKEGADFSNTEQETISNIIDSVHFDNYVAPNNDKTKEHILVFGGMGILVVICIVIFIVSKKSNKENV